MAVPTSLYLAPNDALAAPELGAVLGVLEELAVIGAALADATYAAGPGFSRHVVYAGCSPHLVMEPPADGSANFCHVAVHGPFATPRLVNGPNTVAPRCPACRTRVAGWRERLGAWRAADARLVCQGCGATLSPHDLDWRGHALSGRCLIELRNVFPGEASPSDLLLRRLREATGLDWRYAWAGALLAD